MRRLRHPLINLAATGSVRSRLTLLALACMLPLIVFTVALIYADYARNLDQLRNSTAGRAPAMVSVLEREFARTEAAMLTLSTMPLSDGESFRRRHAPVTLAQREMNA